MQQPRGSRRSSTIRDEEVAVDIGERIRLSPVHHLSRLTHRADVVIGVGAVIGVITRFTISNLARQHLPGTFPFGTLMINLAGCLVIGMMQTLFLELVAVRREVQLFVSVGFCGGFTTFSTFSVETVLLIQAGHALRAGVYQGVSLIGGLIAVMLGIMLTHTLHRQGRGIGGGGR